MPNLSTIFTYTLYFIPFYLFVLSPLISQIVPSSWWSGSTTYYNEYDYAEDDLLPTTGVRLDDDTHLSIEDGVPIECPGDEYKVHLLRQNPLVIYIEGFLSIEEADHMLEARYSFPFSPLFSRMRKRLIHFRFTILL